MNHHVVIHVTPGVGGAEAAHTAFLLRSMYLARAKRLGFTCFSLYESTIHIIGENAVAAFATEAGIHKVCRISPFDAQRRRCSSFADVTVNGGRGPLDGTVGGVVRTYVLDPHQLATDHRTGGFTNRIADVFAGDLDALLKPPAPGVSSLERSVLETLFTRYCAGWRVRCVVPPSGLLRSTELYLKRASTGSSDLSDTIGVDERRFATLYVNREEAIACRDQWAARLEGLTAGDKSEPYRVRLVRVMRSKRASS